MSPCTITLHRCGPSYMRGWNYTHRPPKTYGDPSSAKFARAQRNFAKSLAGREASTQSLGVSAVLNALPGYSVVTYLLQIKDRHNGNILLDRDGHLIHIDFGFMLSNTPGNIGFEAAPFKLPGEYIAVLGGVEGPAFLEFKKLFKDGFEAARKHCDRIISSFLSIYNTPLKLIKPIFHLQPSSS